LLSLAVAAAEPLPETAPDPQPGDRGVVRTAIQGTQIEEIPVRYLARQRDAVGPGYDLHLVQLEGPVAERVGVAAGMSGSPVYFAGRLIGALSYRLGALPIEAVAGVTPIEDIRRAAPRAASGIASPIATPVQIGGLSAIARGWIEPQLESLGLRLVAGAAGSAADGIATELRAGSPVGVALVLGDLSVAATGTVTLVEGDRVYAFGHPFLGTGRVELPMVAAEVIHTLADEAGSVKLARVGASVGAIVDDRLTAIVGIRGATARMIPLGLHVRGRPDGEQTLRFEIARSQSLTPLLAALAVINSLVGSPGYEHESTAILSGRLRIRGYPDVPVELAASSQGAQDPALAVAVRLQQVLAALWRNPFSALDLDGIDLDVTFGPGARSYQLDGVHYDRAAVRPGARVSVTCSLRRYRGAVETRRVEIAVPVDVPHDVRLTIAVGPPDYIDQALGQPVGRRLRSSRDLGAAIEALSELGSAHHLQVVLLGGTPGIVTRGLAYDRLPPTAEKLLGGAPAGRGSRTHASVLSRAEVVLDGPVEGGVVAALELEGAVLDVP